jgi:hypothetical protein
MINGGLAVAVVVEGLLAVGIGLAVGGAIALATLLPSVQLWLSGRTVA